MEKPVNIIPVKLAPVYKRLVNYIIDVIICYIIALLTDQAGIALDANYGYDGLVLGPPIIGNLKFAMFLAVIQIVYYGLFETLTGRTIGKYATETRVIARDGSVPDSNAIFLRTLCRQIPFEFISFIGIIPMGWHDSLSKTLVVDNYDFKMAQQNNVAKSAETEDKSE